MIEHLKEAARESGRILREGFGQVRELSEKGRATDLVTEYDKASERFLREWIQERFPDHAQIGEEEENQARPDAEWTWIFDPLDGTVSFAYGIPFFAVCIGLRHRDTTVAGVVYEPIRDEMFWAQRGGGAFLNGRPIRVTEATELERSLLATGFPYSIRENPNRTLETFAAVVPHARGIRRMGTAGIDLAYVACGRLDGYWESFLQPWDCAAGVLLVEEAGGKVSDYLGNPHDIFGLQTVATNGRIHGQLLDRIQEGQRA
ncbi:MAG TPA: inositol monophosphatase family protein [Fibrobacteria bacterium]|nr:inositol monophosphatase family protein [Fibrobacteria bacterium]